MDLMIPVKENAYSRQVIDERLEGLKDKSVPETEPDLVKEQLPFLIPSQEQGSQTDKPMAPKLLEVLKKGDVEEFVNVLEQVYKEKDTSISAIIDQTTLSGNSLLHVAATQEQEEIVDVIAHHFPYLLTRRNILGNTPLHVAAKVGTVKTIGTLLRHGKLLEGGLVELTAVQNELGNTALHIAVSESRVEETKCLFEADPRVTYLMNKAEESPICMAILEGKDDLVDILSDAPFEKNEDWDLGNLPVHAAIFKGRQIQKKSSEWVNKIWEITGRILLGRKPQPSTVMLERVLKKKPELMQLRDKKGRSAIDYAAAIGYVEGVRLLFDKFNASVSERSHHEKGHLPIHFASKHGRLDVVKELLQPRYCPDLGDMLNKRGRTILHVAAKNGKNEVVKYLLKKTTLMKTLKNERDREGNTALHLATSGLHPKVVLYLTWEKGADLKLRNNEKRNALEELFINKKLPGSFRKVLTQWALRSAGCLISYRVYKTWLIRSGPPRKGWFKDRVNTLLLVATLVATVTFAAAFTVPGGFHSASDPDPGMAVMVNKKMFQVFTICDVIAVYSSLLAAFLLLWADEGDFYIAGHASDWALYLLGMAIATMSLAFTSALYLVVSKVTWLSIVALILGITLLFAILTLFLVVVFPHLFPLRSESNTLLRFIWYYFIRILVPISGSYAKLAKLPDKQNNQKEGTRLLKEDSSSYIKPNEGKLKQSQNEEKQRESSQSEETDCGLANLVEQKADEATEKPGEKKVEKGKSVKFKAGQVGDNK